MALTRTSTSGYSLIEVMVGVALFSIISLASVNLFFNTTVGSTKDNSTRVVKQNGDTVVSLLENSLRSAAQLDVNNEGLVCESDMQSISLELIDTQEIEIWSVSNGKIMVNGEDLTGDEVTVLDNRFYIDCSYDPGSRVTFVKVDFSLIKGSPSSDKQEEYILQKFETSVTLRNKK